ncbi:MAG: DnaJ domain-containing protein [Rhodospirillaceae bacterium]|nr:DnaJ domain-containing protein [Rhodospirillaceae bacterium]
MDIQSTLSTLGDQPAAGRCEHPACAAAGIYRAPKAHHQLNDYYWFCLDHVREYNKNWNFCAGLDAKTIEREIRNDTVWRRPTWPLNGNSRRSNLGAWFEDDLEILEDIIDNSDSTHAKQSKQFVHDEPEAAQAMRAMNLVAPLTLTALKSRYKDLVKRLHPDTNNGDKNAEDKLKSINEAYATLKKFATR